MKKKIWLPILFTLSLFFAFSFGVIAAAKVSMWFNNKALKTDVRLINNKPYVPLNDITKLFGGKVTYDKNTNAYKVTSKDFKTPTANQFKSYTVNVTQQIGPMTLKIKKVTVNPSYSTDQASKKIKTVILDIELSNISDDKIYWHPAYGTFAFNTKEQVDDIYYFTPNLAGDFLGKVVKRGQVVLEIKGALENISSFNYEIEPPLDDEDYRIGESKLINVKFR